VRRVEAGAELRSYRTRAGLSQKDLAAKANVSHDMIIL
jgi:transcriptional regulator with XRE-family HTH domain